MSQRLWTFDGTAPGPTLHGRVGDVFEITLVNDGTIGHSIDFHAGALAPDQPMRTIPPGESLTYRFTATRGGIWMYHCSTMPMSAHIANGLFGAVVIDPPGLPAVDRELPARAVRAVPRPAGRAACRRGRRVHGAADRPDVVVFNGYRQPVRPPPLPARVGERVRIWVLDAGPNRATAFHVVGGQFDTVYAEGAWLLRAGPGRQPEPVARSRPGRLRRAGLPRARPLPVRLPRHGRRRARRARHAGRAAMTPTKSPSPEGPDDVQLLRMCGLRGRRSLHGRARAHHQPPGSLAWRPRRPRAQAGGRGAARGAPQPHVVAEEAGLFTVMARDELFTDHIARLCAEHHELDDLLARVADGEVALYPRFEDALREHIDREDNGLFPAAAIHLGGPEWDEVEQLTPRPRRHRGPDHEVGPT